MTDLSLVNGAAGLDLELVGGDLGRDDGLETAVLLSLFTDARADLGEVGEGGNVRGWWADRPGDRWGSKGWLLENRGLSAPVAAEYRRHVEDALRWLVTRRIASSVEVEVLLREGSRLELGVRIVRGTARGYDAAWRAAAARDYSVPGARLRVFFG